MGHTSFNQLCELFLQMLNQYRNLEKKAHTYDTEPKIYLAEIHTIAAVGKHEDINVTNLAKLQGTSRSAASQAVSKLVKKGFLEKKISPKTDNEVVLCLTEKGKQVYTVHEQQHIWLKSQLHAVFEKYPQGTIDMLSQLAADVQKIWEQFPDK